MTVAVCAAVPELPSRHGPGPLRQLRATIRAIPALVRLVRNSQALH